MKRLAIAFFLASAPVPASDGGFFACSVELAGDFDSPKTYETAFDRLLTEAGLGILGPADFEALLRPGQLFSLPDGSRLERDALAQGLARLGEVMAERGILTPAMVAKLRERVTRLRDQARRSAAVHDGARKEAAALDLRRVLGKFDGDITSLAFSPDGLHLAAGTARGKIHLIDRRNGTFRDVMDWRPVPRGIRALAFQPSGALIAASSVNVEWEEIFGTNRWRQMAAARGFQSVRWEEVLFSTLSEDGRWLALGMEKDPEIVVGGLGEDQEPVLYMRLDDGRWSVSHSRFAHPPKEERSNRRIFGLRLSPRGNQLWVNLGSGESELVDLGTNPLAHGVTRKAVALVSWRGNAASLAFTPNGATILTPYGIWLAADGSSRFLGNEPLPWLRHDVATAIDRNGEYVAFATPDGIAVHDTGLGHPVGAGWLPSNSHSLVLSAAFSRDGKWLAAGEEDGTVSLWDFEWVLRRLRSK